MQKREGIKIFLFLVIFVLLLISVSYIVRTNGGIKDRFAGFYAEERDSIDVLLFGSSAAGQSFAPGVIWKETGITSYPLATNAQRTKAIRYLLEEAYKTQNPQLVVVELRMFAYEDEEAKQDTPHIREVTDNMKYSLHRIKTINALVENDEEGKITFYLDIMKYHSNWKMLFLPEEWKKFDFQCNDINKGYEAEFEIMPHEVQPEPHYENRVPIPKEQERELRNLLAFLKEKNQEALFVVAVRIFDEEYQGKMNYMKDIVEGEGFGYLDMNDYYDEMKFDFRTDVSDGVHVNILGAKKSSELLGKYIAEHYGITDKRQLKKYESWDASAESFDKQYQECLIENEKFIKEEIGE